jgi:hypothetical protein
MTTGRPTGIDPAGGSVVTTGAGPDAPNRKRRPIRPGSSLRPVVAAVARIRTPAEARATRNRVKLPGRIADLLVG